MKPITNKEVLDYLLSNRIESRFTEVFSYVHRKWINESYANIDDISYQAFFETELNSMPKLARVLLNLEVHE